MQPPDDLAAALGNPPVGTRCELCGVAADSHGTACFDISWTRPFLHHAICDLPWLALMKLLCDLSSRNSPAKAFHYFIRHFGAKLTLKP